MTTPLAVIEEAEKKPSTALYFKEVTEERVGVFIEISERNLCSANRKGQNVELRNGVKTIDLIEDIVMNKFMKLSS